MTVNSHNSNSYACCTILVAGVLSTFSGVSCNTKPGPGVYRPPASETRAPEAVDINRAPPSELVRLPGVGPSLAARIVAFRDAHGPFEKPEDLILVEGMSDKRFRALSHLIRTN